MLDWISGSQRGDYMDSGDDTKLQEPPETPGPVFALRAFKSAIFGTPGIEDEYDEDRFSRPTQISDHRPKSREPIKADENPSIDNRQELELKPKPVKNQPPMGSPTKSILLTPGTAATRRKTVSFGDAVVDDEQKKTTRGGNADKPQQNAGSITSQWNTRRPTPGRKARSKLTQSLLDARETKPSEEEDLLAPEPKNHEPSSGSMKTTGETDGEGLLDEEDGDVTINLEEPRSQSGQYWKSEFENYRAKTDREIRKLIQYRSVAKSYARKKDLEALRLSEKLKAEEAKVAEVERRVSKLASGMVEGSEGEAGREEVVKDLVNQTALALQYKQKVNTLRKTLERHGVVVSDDEPDKDGDKPSGETSGKVTGEQIHHPANSKPGVMMDQKPGMEELQRLVSSSEKKAAELEMENVALKRNLLRVKEEMGKYEDRRKAKEARLKQREQKLESRNQEYRERLSAASKERRDAEDALKNTFNDEKKEMAAQIELLRNQLATAGKVPSISKSEKRRSEKPSSNQHARDGRDDFNPTSGRRTNRRSSDEREALDGPGRNAESGLHRKESLQQTGSGLKSKRSRDGSKQVDIWAIQADSTSKDHDVANLEPSATKSYREEVIAGGNTHQGLPSRGTSTALDHDQTDIPPSSPPQLPSPEASLIEFTPPAKAEEQPPRQHYQPKIHAFQSPRPSIVPFRPAPTKHSEDKDYHQSDNLHTQQYPQSKITKRPSAVALDRDAHLTPTASAPDRSLLSSSRKGSAIARRDAIPADRLAAASARLQAMPKENRKSGGGGKENAHPGYR